ncbi:response regulator transcription factor [Aminobacter sp. BA135]|uniref:response regulator transcription factor n=2 Tax=Aminobacter TaxID=31988 RepID=UPI003D7B02E0
MKVARRFPRTGHQVGEAAGAPSSSRFCSRDCRAVLGLQPPASIEEAGVGHQPACLLGDRAMNPSILVVDDDPDIRNVIGIALERAGMHVQQAANGRLALEQLRRHHADLVVLDIGMPVMDGIECCKAIRASSHVPIVFLTAHDDEVDRIVGFELGADDYVSKPFSPRELLLRIKAILARGKQAGSITRHGDLSLDSERHICSLAGKDLPLTATEFSVLEILSVRPGIVVGRGAMIDKAYGGNNTLSGRTVDSHVRNIRAKAAVLGYSDIIETVRGVGLRLGNCVAGPGTA